MSPAAWNGYAQRVYYVDGIRKNAQPMENIVLGASDDTLEVGRVKKIGTDFLPKHDFPHKTLIKYNFYFPEKRHSASTSLRSAFYCHGSENRR